MGFILGKRALREFRSHAGRYMSLIFMTALAMYIVVSLLSAVETVIQGSAVREEASRTEDGEFSSLLPLTEAEQNRLERAGVEIEKKYSIDIVLSGGTTLRVMKNREKINLIDLDEGRPASDESELVLEKRYCEENHIAIGDPINISGIRYSVVGIGSVPDYDMPLDKLSDTAAQSDDFGLAFMTDAGYEALRSKGAGTEEYTYAYLRKASVPDEDIKSILKTYKVDPETVEDKAFQDYWEENGASLQDFFEGTYELRDASAELADGLSEMEKNNRLLYDAADRIFQYHLAQASGTLSEKGLAATLTEDNYQDVLEKIRQEIGAPISLAVGGLLDDLRSVQSFRDDIGKYTDSEAEAADGATELADGAAELADGASELEDKLDFRPGKMVSFLTKDENIRIHAAADDIVTKRMLGLAAGVVGMALIAYIISVFIVHQIQSESAMIGTLYALGVSKSEIMRHYMILPVVTALAGGVLGCVAGFSPFGTDFQLQSIYSYFSVPLFEKVIPVYIVLYAVLMPPLAAAAVNAFVIRRNLSATALSLMRNEQKVGRLKEVTFRKDLGFIRTFRRKQLLKERRSVATVVFGIFLSVMILMLGIDTWVYCTNVKRDAERGTPFRNMYILKYPVSESPENAGAYYMKQLKREKDGFELEITVVGMPRGKDRYFSGKPKEGLSRIVISEAVRQRYGLKVGDRWVLTDDTDDRDYAFTVTGVNDHVGSLMVFMDIESARELFGAADDEINLILSDTEPDIDTGRVYSVTTYENITNAAGVYLDQMIPTVYMLITVSIVIFCAVMYLMLNVMIDRASFGISLARVFGYRTRELGKLYLNGNTAVVATGSAVSVMASKLATDAVYPKLIANCSSGIDLSFPWYLYAGIYAGIMAVYFAVKALLMLKIHRISAAEILKNRE